jgi:glycosyltransferase involved in cell wall biosynthesis
MLKYPSLTLTTFKGLLDLGVRSPIGYVGDITAVHASDEIISPSSNLANLLSHDCFVSKEKIHFVPNAVDVQQLDRLPVDDTVLEDNSLVNGGYLLYIGRLSAVKGIHNLIEAFGRIGKKKELKLVIAGTGDYDHTLRRQAQKFCNVVFTGFVGSSEIKKSLYRNCLALMLPSLYEASPLVVLEAMTYGKPVVASCVGDIPSIVKNGVNGLLVKPNDINGLVQAIARLYEDPDLRKNMGLRNRSVIMGNFTVEKMATRTFQVYSKLMEGD